jgi:hypothetical protein
MDRSWAEGIIKKGYEFTRERKSKPSVTNFNLINTNLEEVSKRNQMVRRPRALQPEINSLNESRSSLAWFYFTRFRKTPSIRELAQRVAARRKVGSRQPRTAGRR